MHDVCAAAQVSLYTVSRALNGERGVSARTRERVRAIATEIGYVPNQHARNLKSRKSSVVAVLTANIANHYYAGIVSSLEKAIEGNGYNCITMDAMFNGAYSQEREDRFIESLMAQRVAAAIVTYNLSAANMAALASWDLPLVFVDCPAPLGFEQYFSVTTDSFQGSREIGLHLASHGYKRWGFVGHTSTWSTREPRQSGFEAAAELAGASVAIVEGLNSSATAREAVTAYLTQTPREQWPEVFYASNTVLLHGTMNALKSMSLSIPDDVAVVAFDDFEWAEMLDPPITVIDQDIAAIGTAAGAYLLRRLKSGKPKVGDALVLKPSLRIRQSCGCGRVAGVPKA